MNDEFLESEMERLYFNDKDTPEQKEILKSMWRNLPSHMRMKIVIDERRSAVTTNSFCRNKPI